MKKFHQFVRIERGPVNAAIIDILSGNVFQAPLDVVDKFEGGKHDDIGEFIEFSQAEKLMIDIESNAWIPPLFLEPDPDIEGEKEPSIELHLEEGIPLRQVLGTFQNYSISKVYYYGTRLPDELRFNPKFELREKNFERCRARTRVDGNFCKIQESIIRFNMRYNSCWGTVIAMTGEGKIRPCIHSKQVIGHIDEELKDIGALMEKMNPYWAINKDKVKHCRDCEFRYLCFDCREIAIRQNGKMDEPNPLCGYNPYTGEWKK